jgi:gamma-glutamyltranspeptidase / glutathione hydrolase
MTSPPLVPMPLARGARGAVVAPHHLAATAGLGVLAAGGSAVDAAIATNAVLAVVMPNGCGIGGDAFWLIWDASSGRQLALNGSGRSAAATDAAALRGRGLATLPLRGGLSITVPGAVRSWGDAHERFGRLDVTAVLGPAIELARDGFPAWDGFIGAVERTVAILDADGVDGRGFGAVYQPNGRPWRPGQVVRLHALATTLERLADDGFGAFYEGDLAERQAVALAAAGSAIDAGDLAGHRSTWTEPIETTYRGVRVTTHPPNSSGIVALEILNVLEQFEPRDTVGWIHLGIEASKLAMADRDVTLCDPEFREIPIARLLDKGYAAELARRIDPSRAAAAPAATAPRGGGTVYLAVVDAAGNAVSLIQSNYMGFGSGVVDPDTGIHYQNRGSHFSLDARRRNVLEPGKRPLHTLMPGMLFRGNEPAPWVVLGSMGGDAQPQIHAQVVSALVDRGADIATAVGGPRWFVEPREHYAPPVDVLIEPRFEAGVLEGLAALGHPVTSAEPFDGSLGHCHAIELVDGGPRDSGSLAAATDPRSAGLPAVR